jgi:hypothetical protein
MVWVYIRSSYGPYDGHIIDPKHVFNQKRHPVIRFSKTLLCLTAILTNSNHQHSGMEGTEYYSVLFYVFCASSQLNYHHYRLSAISVGTDMAVLVTDLYFQPYFKGETPVICIVVLII